MNKKQTTHWLKVAVIGIALGFALQFVRAWTEPTAAPPGGNVGAPINTGSLGQAKTGGLGIMGGFVTDMNTFLARLGGNVGIGTVSPSQKMDVAGKIKIGNDAVAPTAGTIRWSGTDFEGFDGTAWKSFTATGGGGDHASCSISRGSGPNCEGGCVPTVGNKYRLDNALFYFNFEGYTQADGVYFTDGPSDGTYSHSKVINISGVTLGWNDRLSACVCPGDQSFQCQDGIWKKI